MKSDLQFLFVHGDPQISVIHVVVVLKDEPRRFHGWLIFEITNVSAKVGLLRGLTRLAFYQAIHVVASIATHDERHFVVVAAKTNTPRKPLVIMRMSGQKCVW